MKRFYNWLKEQDTKFSYSFLGFIIGIGGLIFSVYSIYFYKEAPILRFDILTNTNILDVREDVNKLSIFYDSIDLSKSPKNIRVITLKVSNVGSKGISVDDYDRNSPIGIKLNNAEIIQSPVVIESSNSYFKDNVKFDILEKNTITFPEIIINPDDFFMIKFLALSEKDSAPLISSIGYLFEMGAPILQSFVDSEGNTKEENNPIKKYIGFAIISGFLILLGGWPFIKRYFAQRKLKAFIKKYEKFVQKEDVECQKLINKYFLKSAGGGLYRISKLIEAESYFNQLNDFFDARKEFSTKGVIDFHPIILSPGASFSFATEEIEKYGKKYDYMPAFTEGIFNNLKKDGIILLKDGNWIIDDDFKRAFNKFIEFLKYQ
jgi:hypothetical protein